ncbi:MAG: class I SAM-dependent methyltransferase [Anaerolineae bacterium]|jgi:SAM-dependent methyltransferase|nr:class I SAM-dependent methyltransferase [Anaerolineae bacterium]MDH7472530.1 class I SAM-dependent methyltransferase [Anaerolineae bacterium]
MSGIHVNYNDIVPTYNQRYEANALPGVAAALLFLVQNCNANQVLEAGCGTGHWLTVLQSITPRIYGLDLSLGMLQQVCRRERRFHLTCGDASQLTFPTSSFDLVFCVNALHHFAHPPLFISETQRVLKPGGVLAIIGMDPHSNQDRWYLYDYFDGTHATDLARFPSGRTILDWMSAAGFTGMERRVVERIFQPLIGWEVLDSPFLQKRGTSQLALLTDEAYAAGLERIKTELSKAEACGEILVFPVDISLIMITGRRNQSE